MITPDPTWRIETGRLPSVTGYGLERNHLLRQGSALAAKALLRHARWLQPIFPNQ